ncbi:hypothetical protein ONZ45_g8765 [Pleurotus djamor]|nr:hypothetical protein ONZ45_g8765 [Pleurotus djamor]
MGFLKRLFSVGSKKNKKTRPTISNPTPLPVVPRSQAEHLHPIEEDQEDAVNRLLRSSSSRYAVMSEVDYTSLSPLPHPINDVIQTPSASSVSLASSSISQRGTYSVTIHRRKQHAATEFPDANRGLDGTPSPGTSSAGLDATPRETDVHLLGLRRDPSVASLIDLYDEHGRLPDEAFSNSPPEGRAQTKRTGSTLRQLLGNPQTGSQNRNTEYSTVEGDISWAERFLGETDSISSASSYGLRTPNDPNAHFTDEPSIQSHIQQDISFATDHDLSMTTFDHPGISSMEVELSSVADNSFHDEPTQIVNKSPYQAPDPTTPQRASQIFGFITKRFSHAPEDVNERSLPDLPSAFSSPSDDQCHMQSHFSDNTSFDTDSVAPSVESHIPHTTDTRSSVIRTSSILQTSNIPRTPSRNSYTSRRSSVDYQAIETMQPGAAVHTVTIPEDEVAATPLHKVKVIMNGPTKVIVTAPTPCDNPNPNPSSMRLPRGPRAPGSRRRTSHSRPPSRPRLVERSNTNSSEQSSSGRHSGGDYYTSVPTRIKRPQSRTSSQISVVDVSFDKENSPAKKPSINRPMRPARNDGGKDLLSQAIATQFEKENANALTAVASIPYTPMRSNSNRASLFRTAVTPNMFRPPPDMAPSPASSSELSPVGREMMSNLRQQRSKAREADRDRARQKSGRIPVRI